MAELEESTSSLEHQNNGDNGSSPFMTAHEMAKELEEMVVKMVSKIDEVQSELTKKREYCNNEYRLSAY
ncbi:hypothetical protein TRICI_004703 [Trichomonascus ciferrii]|uniref:Uncharacterized protein n=1 Tax=Trichomonascus ciferrii TaxID=44093 RepID=A0A642UZU9_9ASCO|nr:hypothetical protein TRICI_004703 [Trichomonascus ciferrii]